MPVPQSTDDDRHLTRYLLGQLAEDDADRLDELAVVDDDMAWRVRVVENDLVDAYVRGVLDAKSRQQFEAHYLASPKRRAKVRFAERFARAVDASKGPAAERQPEETRGWLERLVPRSAPIGGWGFAYGAAALLLIVSSGLLLMRGPWQGRVVHESERARVPSIAPPPSASSSASRSALPSTSPSISGSVSPSTPPLTVPESAPEPGELPITAVALVLWPQTRGAEVDAGGPAAGGATPAVAVRPGVTRVTLQLQLEAPDFVRYAATLRDSATNRVVWQGDRFAADMSGAQPMVPVAVPANLLKARAYVLELTGYDAAGSGDVIGSYAFHITRP
jgi:hypothetical protein